jgi:hypothetical protein
MELLCFLDKGLFVLGGFLQPGRGEAAGANVFQKEHR